MDVLPQPIRARRRALYRSLGVALFVLPLLAGCIALPDLDEALRQAPAQTTKVYAADGSLIAELHAEENREVIPLAAVPQHVRDAVVAVEDARFYSHPGIDLQGILRALSRNAQEGRVVEGGSTITQQLVKNTVSTNERTLERKVREAILAFQLEQRFTKDEILEKYLNAVYFGRGAYGIEAAARVFFGKHARRLKLHEGALLAGLIRAPGRFDPGDAEAARERRAYVLRRMRDERMITSDVYERERERPLGLRPSADTNTYPYGYFVEYVKQQIFDGAGGLNALGDSTEERVNAVFKGGLRIYTTLDPRLQRVAEENAATTLPYKSDPYNAFVGVKPRTGAIVSMVGGRGFFKNDRFKKLNLAVRRRSPGSSFKPFTLIAALEHGIPLQRSYRGGSRLTLQLPNGQTWPIGNYQGLSFGSTVTLLRATALSVNVVYAQVVLEVGAESVVKVAHKMGITSALDAVPAISIGSEEVTPLEMAQAYATLANQGSRVRLSSIERITDAAGTELYRYEPKPKQVLTKPVAAVATDALAEVMRSGTGSSLDFGRPAAGKTGTSENYADAWYAGFTPDYVGISWVGFPEGQVGMVPPRTRIRVYGSSWPGQMWQRWMIAAHRGLPTAEFPIADELYVSVRVDASRDCLPNAFTPPYLIRTIQYLKGSEPTETCTEPKSGRIASTPDVIGDEASAGRQTLLEAGFRVETVTKYCPAFRKGRVCDQTPEPGTSSTVGKTATIYVSGAGEVSEVPMVLGRTADRARQKLEDHGYKVVVRTASNGPSSDGCRDTFSTDSGRVWLQNPCAGSALRRGGTVTITVNP